MAFNKFGAKKTIIDGITFDSKAEAKRYSELLILQKVGEIQELQLQPKFELHPSFKHNGKTERAIIYVADFMYTEMETGITVVEDVKGIETKDFKIKRKMFLNKYGDMYDFRIIKM